jgi:hypothetical protein
MSITHQCNLGCKTESGRNVKGFKSAKKQVLHYLAKNIEAIEKFLANSKNLTEAERRKGPSDEVMHFSHNDMKKIVRKYIQGYTKGTRKCIKCFEEKGKTITCPSKEHLVVHYINNDHFVDDVLDKISANFCGLSVAPAEDSSEDEDMKSVKSESNSVTSYKSTQSTATTSSRVSHVSGLSNDGANAVLLKSLRKTYDEFISKVLPDDIGGFTTPEDWILENEISQTTRTDYLKHFKDGMFLLYGKSGAVSNEKAPVLKSAEKSKPILKSKPKPEFEEVNDDDDDDDESADDDQVAYLQKALQIAQDKQTRKGNTNPVCPNCNKRHGPGNCKVVVVEEGKKGGDY